MEEFLKSVNIMAKLQARRLIVSRTLGARALSCWKMKNLLELLYNTIFV